MIDWFASKVGMLIFLAIVLSVLLGFVAMENRTFAFEQKARMAEDVSRIIDATGNGESMTYEPPVQNYNLIISSADKSVSVDGVVRHFLANANSTSIMNAPKLTISNIDGVVYAS